MTVSTNSVTMAGAHSIFCAYRNTYGIVTGWANLSSTNTGTVSGMHRIKGVEQVPNPVTQPNRVRRTYDDGPGRVFTFAGVQVPQADLQFGITDIDLENAAQNTTSWTRGNWKKTVRGLSAPIFTDLVVVAHSQATSEDTATNGTNGFWNTLYGDVQLLPLGQQQFQAQQTADVRYSATINPFTQYVDGSLLSDTAKFSSADGTSISWFSVYPTLFTTKIGDGTAATVVLDYTPVDAASMAVSIATISGGVVTVTAGTVSSVSVATKTVTLSAAPASGAYIVVEYEAARLY